MKRILLLNRKNTDNLGDIAINLSMKKLIESIGNECIDEDFAYPNESGYINITASKTSENNVSIAYGIRRKFLDIIRLFPMLYCYVWYFQNRRLFKVLDNQRIDAVIIGGGELVQPNLLFPIALYWWTKSIRNHGIDKCVLFGVGVTREWEPFQKRLVTKSLRHIDDIYVRDKESQRNMQMIFGMTAHLLPDAVFVNKIENKGKGEYSLYGITDFRRIRKHASEFTERKGYYECSLKEIKDIENETHQKVYLFYTTKADLDECRVFKAYCKKEHNVNLKIANISVLDELKAYISDAIVIASPRMHACILGKLSQKDVRSILISTKMKSFAELYKDFDSDTSSLYQRELTNALRTALNN